MSYAKFRDMVELCGHLQARSMGLTITELMQLTERSRKTVERMLGTLIGLGLVEANHIRDSDHHLTKRWRLEGSAGAPIHLFMKGFMKGTRTLKGTFPIRGSAAGGLNL